ncbi:sugar nucleotide-binding protein [Candidatus Azambacteria bacterium]|nr:sugar nucleotide-binding protein [Candidatus Azambacteria bacterium]
MKYLIFGNGYIGNKFKNAFSDAEITETDIGNIDAVRLILEEKKPDIVINCAGRTGRPNIDWCEDHKEETLYSNVTGPFILAKACFEKSVFMAHLGSGCIYQGDNNGNGFSEEDVPDINSMPSFYSLTKFVSEYMLDKFPILQVRLRMPLDSEKSNRNFITKITNYEKVINEPNSMTVIDDLIIATKKLIEKKKTGIYNVTNPGSITHKEILDMYKELVDPDFKYQLIDAKSLKTKAGRSNCILSTKKLEDEGIKLPEIHEAMREVLKHYK